MIAGSGAFRRLAEFHQQADPACSVGRAVLGNLLAWSVAAHGTTICLQKECTLTSSLLRQGWTLPQIEQALDDLFRAGLIAVDSETNRLKVIGD